MQAQTQPQQRLLFQATPPVNYPLTGATCIAWLLDSVGAPLSADFQAVQRSRRTQTDYDPQALQQAANAAGLQAERGIVAVDDLASLLQEQAQQSQPLLLRLQSADSDPYWAVLITRVGHLYQLADPRLGLRWVTEQTLQAAIIKQVISLSRNKWQADPLRYTFDDGLVRRLQYLGLSAMLRRAWLHDAQDNLETAAALAAASRMLVPLVRARQVRPGNEAQTLLQNLLAEPYERIPARFWVLSYGPDGDDVHLNGAEVLRVTQWPPPARFAPTLPNKYPRWLLLFPAVLRPYIRLESRSFLLLVALGAVLSAGAVFIQAILLTALLDLGVLLTTPTQRAQVIALLLGFALTLLLLKWWMQRSTLAIGHRLDARLRLALLALLPNLSAQYPRQFALGDLFERLHSARALRQMPHYISETVQLSLLLVFTLVGLFWLDPLVGLLGFLRLGTIVIASLLNQVNSAAQTEARYHLGRLSRLYLDVFQGLLPLRAHSAEAAISREYGRRVQDWGRALWGQFSLEIWLSFAVAIFAQVLIALMLALYVLRQPNLSGWLLLLYWAFSLQSIGQQLLGTLFYLRRDQVKVERFSQTLDAPTESATLPHDPDFDEADDAANTRPVAITLQGVGVVQAGHTQLQDIDLEIAAGEHIAILGASGSGKSTLLALLLGLQGITSGELRIDERPYSYESLQVLRQRTAWVSADVQLWQRSLLDNLQYGNQGQAGPMAIPDVIDAAYLADMLERLPEGLQTGIGADGRRLSGGEGQRVRYGRALGRSAARLVLLDEPFREMEPERRQALLQHTRIYWQNTTLLYVTHTPTLAQGFDRVLVLSDGKIAQQGAPDDLATQLDGPYARMLADHQRTQQSLWQTEVWRHWQLSADGTLEQDTASQSDATRGES